MDIGAGTIADGIITEWRELSRRLTMKAKQAQAKRDRHFATLLAMTGRGKFLPLSRKIGNLSNA